MKMRVIRVSLVGVSHDYVQSLLPLVLREMGFRIQYTKPASSDLLIYGPFGCSAKKPFRWLPRPARSVASSIALLLEDVLKSRATKPLSLFHTAENTRHDAVPADFSISSDLSVHSNKHFRLPYWMELVDWSLEGLSGNLNPRFGQLLSIARMMQPLGKNFLERPRKAAIFSSHLREPRATLVKVVGDLIPLTGYGPYFDKDIADHHRSGFTKIDTLQNFAFNLCPENGLYPGYYTEKIPEAFLAGCLPITWTDTNVCADFNPDALINLEPMASQNYAQLKETLNAPTKLAAYAEQPLLLSKPSIEPFRDFLKEVVRQATS